MPETTGSSGTVSQTRRQRLEAVLQQGDFPALVQMAATQRGVVTSLLHYLFDPESLLCWRAIEGLGILAQTHPGKIKQIIPRLLWLLNEESGSFGWGAAAVLGEIGRNNLDLVDDIVLIMFSLLDEVIARPPMLWGLARFGQVHPQVVREGADKIVALLTDPEPLVRAHAAWCAGIIAAPAAGSALQRLGSDPTPVKLYIDGALRPVTVGQVAGEALQRLQA